MEMLSGMLDAWVSLSEKKTWLDCKSQLGRVLKENGLSLFPVIEMGAKDMPGFQGSHAEQGGTVRTATGFSWDQDR